jgi:hypothetical protein
LRFAELLNEFLPTVFQMMEQILGPYFLLITTSPWVTAVAASTTLTIADDTQKNLERFGSRL